MSTVDEVNFFLEQFKVKKKIWGILFSDFRGKNAQALADLEFKPADRESVIDSLHYKDYSEGPLAEKLYNGSNMWVFGKIIKQKEVYIKISMGGLNNSTICISFHISEYKMKFPFNS